MDPSQPNGRRADPDLSPPDRGRGRLPVRAATASRWGAADLRNWGIRPKLVAVLLLPTIAALLLGGLRMESALGTSASYTRLESLAVALPQTDMLVDALQSERDLTSGLLSATPPQSPVTLGEQRNRTDAAANAVRIRLIGVDTTHDSALLGRLRGVLSSLKGLAALRRQADSAKAAPASVARDYTNIVGRVLGLTDELSAHSSNGDVTRRAIGLEALAGAKEAASQQRAILYSALLSGTMSSTELTALSAASATHDVDVSDFLAHATAAGAAQYRATVTGPATTTVSRVVRQALSTRSVVGLGVGGRPPQWFSAASAEITMLARVQTGQLTTLVARIHALGRSSRNDALVSAGIIHLILGFALLATLLVARSILRPLKELRAAAFDVAYQRLPETVRALQDSDLSDGVPDVAPIRVDSADEIGEVARAFDAVHNEAVRLAGEQALMRGNVNKMFVNLSRRSQTLVERQLQLIDELEAGEQDADQLGNLFRLDHLATRMRRNDENLLVLAGAEGGRRRRDPVPMLDVLRAASSEVEQYARVRLDTPAGCEVVGSAVNDLVHLMAELVENATTFSAPSTPVWLRSRSLGASGEVMIEVEDRGVSMTSAELAIANERLARPSSLDVSMSRLMGLFVVARLARRHDIEVQLRAAPAGGVLAFVRLPKGLVSESAAPVVSSNGASPDPEPDVGAESSPIFDTLQSEWFSPRTPATRGVSATPGGRPRPAPNWQSPGDEGWRTAAVLGAAAVEREAFTAAGLPVRVPGRNLIPGTAAVPAAAVPAARGNGLAAHRDPGQSRALSNYQQGIHRARVAAQASARDGQTAAAAAGAGADDHEARP